MEENGRKIDKIFKIGTNANDIPFQTKLISSKIKFDFRFSGEQTCKISHQKSTSWEGNHTATLSRLKLDNERLHREVENLQRQLTAKRKAAGANNSSSTDTAGALSVLLQKIRTKKKKKRKIVKTLVLQNHRRERTVRKHSQEFKSWKKNLCMRKKL